MWHSDFGRCSQTINSVALSRHSYYHAFKWKGKKNPGVYTVDYIEEIQTLYEKYDIIILQETWLSDADIHFLTAVDTRFYCKGTKKPMFVDDHRQSNKNQ